MTKSSFNRILHHIDIQPIYIPACTHRRREIRDFLVRAGMYLSSRGYANVEPCSYMGGVSIISYNMHSDENRPSSSFEPIARPELVGTLLGWV